MTTWAEVVEKLKFLLLDPDGLSSCTLRIICHTSLARFRLREQARREGKMKTASKLVKL